MPVELFFEMIVFDQRTVGEQEIQCAPAILDRIADKSVARRVADRDVANLCNVVVFDPVAGAVPEAQAIPAFGRIGRARAYPGCGVRLLSLLRGRDMPNSTS